MDVIIASHNLKAFSTAVTTLTKMGKHLYFEFDPISGLTLRTLNDAKSCYASFSFDVTFFERCSSPPLQGLRTAQSNGNRSQSQEDPAGRGPTERRRRRKRSRSRGKRRTDSAGEDEDLVEKYLCRVPIRAVASILRPRKGISSLRIKSVGDQIMGEDQNEETEGSLQQLSFEFHSTLNGIMKIIHKVGVDDADGVVAVSSTDNCSEIVAAPKLLLTLLDPLGHTTEVALTVHGELKRITATSFHYANATATSTDNMVLNASVASVLKTETSIDCDEFDEFNFMTEGSDGQSGTNTMPEDIENQVTLVFSIKEAKAMLQFCTQSNIDQDLRVILSFHWGGKPIVIETEGDSFHAKVILATVDHELLQGVNFSSRQQK